MPWIESHTVLIRHRKVLAMSHELRIRASHLIGYLHVLWHAALEQAETGDLSQWSDETIAELSDYPGNPQQYVQLLQKHGFLDGKSIHDWWDYAGRFLQGKYGRTPEKWQAIKKRLQHVSEQFANNIQTFVVPNQQDLTKPNLTEPPIAPQPPPGGSSQPLKPQPETKKETPDGFDPEEIIRYLNSKAGRNFNPTTKPYLKVIKDRHRDGYTADNMRKMIEFKVWDWQERYRNKSSGALEIPEGKELMLDYLTPDTLFRPSKFPKYFEQSIRAQVSRAAKPIIRQALKEQGYQPDAIDKELDERTMMEFSARKAVALKKYGPRQYLRHINDPDIITAAAGAAEVK